MDSDKKKERLRQAQKLVTKVGLVRDAERRNQQNERRLKGFGFIAFADHRSASAALELLNDNPEVFGGLNRPIVEFTIEDKRKLRMQEELYEKHAHKLIGDQAKGSQDAKGKGKGKGDVKGGKGDGKGEGKGKDE